MFGRQSLGYRLTRLCLLGALAIGIVLSLVQIGIDAYRESSRIDARMQSSLALVRDAAAEAAYNIDDGLAQRVVAGLVQGEGVISARVVLPSRELASASGRVVSHRWRRLTDLLFRPQREYGSVLRDGAGTALGELRVSLDTSQAGRDFLNRSALVVLAGLVRASVLVALLLAIFHWVLTRPLVQLTSNLARVDPQAPERASLPIPAGHKHDELGSVVQAINRLLASIRSSHAARDEAEDQASFLRQFDALTQLPNRALFHDRMAQSLDHARRAGTAEVLLWLDIREFHHLNDQYGFAFGDLVLQAVAQRILQRLPEGGQLARISGDHFALLFASSGQLEADLQVAEEMRAQLQAPLELEGRKLLLDVRMGLSQYPADASHVELLVKNALSALSLAKKTGHSGIQFYELRAGEEIRVRHRLRHAIEAAIADGGFELHYQPQFAADDGRVTGVEALLRWPQALAERVSTQDAIRIAEESGHIVALGEWIIRQASADAVRWKEQGLPPLRLAVNVSAVQLNDRGFVGLLDQVLADTGLDPRRLELELTETAMMNNIAWVASRLEQIRDRGLKIAVDDFGTGHSSLQYLKSLPITTLKIDRAFVRDACSDAGDAQIVAAILSLGHSLNKRIVAEGVATEAQLRFLQAQGCDELQGYLLARPMPEPELVAFLRDVRDQRGLIAPGGTKAPD